MGAAGVSADGPRHQDLCWPGWLRDARAMDQHARLGGWRILPICACPAVHGVLDGMADADKTLSHWPMIADVGGAPHVPPPPWAAVGSLADVGGGP